MRIDRSKQISLCAVFPTASDVAAAPICGHHRGFASVIDRLLRNQNPLENCNNLLSSSPHLVMGRRPGNRAAILRSEIHGGGSHSCCDHRCSVRAFDGSTARRLAAAASRGPRPGASRAGWRLRQSHYRLSSKRFNKGQFRSRFHDPLSYCCPTTIFRDPRNRHRHHLSATQLDGRAGNGWARLL